MINIRTEEEIELLRQNNELVSKTLAEVAKIIRPGIATKVLDRRAEEYIRDHGAKPGFLGYNGFPATLCISVNDTVVHGIPSGYELRDGDIVSVDCGTYLHGYYGDSAFTFGVGEVSEPVQRLLKVTRESLELGIEAALSGARVGHIGHAVQQHAERNGYSVVRELVGHGVGRNMHEDPEVPNYGLRGVGPKLRAGMVICIEPMVNMGSKNVYQDSDGWAIRTKDGKPSAHFEKAVAIREGQAALQLTTFDYIDEVLQRLNN
ncbi:MAG: type I methionyl aminopeptidase [Bacteroidales bacterium]|nr:type I methionyl aminopeptidase [Bacteroidales bacterium]